MEIHIKCQTCGLIPIRHFIISQRGIRRTLFRHKIIDDLTADFTMEDIKILFKKAGKCPNCKQTGNLELIVEGNEQKPQAI